MEEFFEGFSRFFKNKARLSVVLGAVFLAVTVGTASVAHVIGGAVPAEETVMQAETGTLTAEQMATTEVAQAEWLLPSEVNGLFLVAGEDFLTGEDSSEETLREELRQTFDQADEQGLNTVIVRTVHDGQTLYPAEGEESVSDTVDVLDVLIDEAKKDELSVCTVVDASLYTSSSLAAGLLSVGARSSSELTSELTGLVKSYDVAAVLLDGYDKDVDEESYTGYLSAGGGIGFDNFKRQSPAALIRTASNTIRAADPAVAVGLLADAEQTSAEDGESVAEQLLKKGCIDFVAVQGGEDGSAAQTWWTNIAHALDVPVYFLQTSAVSSVSEKEDEVLEKKADQVLATLEITKPAQKTYVTAETAVTFAGASDPEAEVIINGKAVQQDSNGYFTVQYDLQAGQNTFVVEHKDQTETYTITRQIELIQQAGPTGAIAVDGGMAVTITAVANENASVYAVVGGQTVSMGIDETVVVSEEDRESSFRTFTGTYTAPEATDVEQNIGQITVYASANGQQASRAAAAITVNKKAVTVVPGVGEAVEDGTPVKIVTDQAITYPPNTADNVAVDTYYPLPAGALDYTVGDPITCTKANGTTYTYYVLASGLRVESSALQTVDTGAGGNTVYGVSISSDGGYTYVRVDMEQQVSYSVDYSVGAIRFNFNYTSAVPSNFSLSSNPLFSSVNWDGTTMVLPFDYSGAFCGYKGYYEGGTLVLRFLNPMSSLSGARIVIDPGHGGVDRGAEGFLSDYPESVVNAQIAAKIADELESRGAVVNLLSNAGTAVQRKQIAESWGADFLVSVHANSAPSADATGTEVYYFHPFSQELAANLSSAVSGALNTKNRGAKQSYYHVTLSSQMPSVLLETGFLSNRGEYEKLISDRYQQKIAKAVADGIAATIS